MDGSGICSIVIKYTLIVYFLQANRIQEKALDLDPQICSTLVVHGLPGFGKSCLVNQVLQTKRFLEVSGSAMFWINLGEHSDTTTVINPLWK